MTVPCRPWVAALSLAWLVGCGSSEDAGNGATPWKPPCPLPPEGLPTDVFCTGLYADRTASSIAPDVMAYQPGVTLWSDGAEKHRFLSLPPDATIDTSDLDAWKFPVGTRAWKEFEVDGALVETRFLPKRGEGAWDVGTYAWDPDGKAATLDTTAPKGTVLSNGYEIPTRKDCDKCHHGASDTLLGVEAVALSLPTAQGATLGALAAAGRLSDPPATPLAALPEDATGQGAAALGYLHANCGMPCHSGRGIGDATQLLLRIRASEVWADGPAASPRAVAGGSTDAEVAMIGKVPVTGAIAQKFPNTQRVAPGAHDQSLVWLLADRRDVYQMPPLVSHAVDEAGMSRLAAWIDALPH